MEDCVCFFQGFFHSPIRGFVVFFSLFLSDSLTYNSEVILSAVTVEAILPINLVYRTRILPSMRGGRASRRVL